MNIHSGRADAQVAERELTRGEFSEEGSIKCSGG